MLDAIMSDLRASLSPNASAGSRLAVSRGVLESYFSAPIAKAIVGSAAKLAARAGLEETAEWNLAFDRELGRLLAVYLPDAGRRMECVSQLAVFWHARPAQERGYDRARDREPAPRAVATYSSRPAAIGSASTSVVVRDQTDIPNACEVVRDLGKKLGFSRVDQTKMATAVSELARNMLQYAGGGTIRFAEVLAPRRGLEAFFEDHGPGIIGLDDMLGTGTMGLGLRGSKGIADEFLIDTQPGDGTRITMRKYVA